GTHAAAGRGARRGRHAPDVPRAHAGGGAPAGAARPVPSRHSVARAAAVLPRRPPPRAGRVGTRARRGGPRLRRAGRTDRGHLQWRRPRTVPPRRAGGARPARAPRARRGRRDAPLRGDRHGVPAQGLRPAPRALADRAAAAHRPRAGGRRRAARRLPSGSGPARRRRGRDRPARSDPRGRPSAVRRDGWPSGSRGMRTSNAWRRSSRRWRVSGDARPSVVGGGLRAWLAPGVRLADVAPGGDPDRLLTRPDCEVVKLQPKVAVGTITTPAGRLFVKRYNVFAWR